MRGNNMKKYVCKICRKEYKKEKCYLKHILKYSKTPKNNLKFFGNQLMNQKNLNDYLGRLKESEVL